jgi:23S rRNA pseudouridine1911/1915/1917 synthase
MLRLGSLATVGGGERPGIVHRLDKDTSGLMVIACSDRAYQELRRAIEAREVKRTYLALVCGHVGEDRGTVELPIGRSLRNRKKMAVDGAAARPALTSYRLRERFRAYDLLEVELGTGRTHQIRVHFSHLGHPVFGDPDYGGREKWHRGMFGPERPLARKLLAALNRQALLAARLQLAHPVTGEALDFSCEPPDDFRSVLDLLRVEGR